MIFIGVWLWLAVAATTIQWNPLLSAPGSRSDSDGIDAGRETTVSLWATARSLKPEYKDKNLVKANKFPHVPAKVSMLQYTS